jgi:hypothetical protein
MESGNPIWWIVSAVIAGCMALVGVGVLFVRAKNIERRWVVALPTLLGTMLSVYILAVQPVWAGGRDTTLPLLAVLIAVFGFAIGRFVDFALGPRPLEEIKQDQATYGADLAD